MSADQGILNPMKWPMALCLVLLVCAGPAALAADDGWRPLFNGQDFSGWERYLGIPPASVQISGAGRDAKGNYVEPLGIDHDPLHSFSIVEVDGAPAIRLSGPIGGGVATLEPFSNYHLKFQFKWGAKRKDQHVNQPRNSGFLYHAYGRQGDVKDRWMNSHQFQIQEGRTGEYIAMGEAAADIHARRIDDKHFVYDPAGDRLTFGNKTPAGPACGRMGEEYEKPVGEWNTLELICVGDECIQVVNGHVTLRVAASRQLSGNDFVPLTKGRLELQMEGWEIYFRDIQICPITKIPDGFATR
jgi:hypothetical protein